MSSKIILEDKAQKEGEHTSKNDYFISKGISVQRVPLPVGDYIFANDKVLDVISRKNKRGISLKKMDFLGTYDVCVDTKFDIQELVSDICGKSHERFRDECILAQNNGIKLYVLVENQGGEIKYTRGLRNHTVRNLEELKKWINPRLHIKKNSSEIIGFWKNGKPRYKKIPMFPNATTGMTLCKACSTMQAKYGVEFIFCSPDEAGERILSLLNVKQEE